MVEVENQLGYLNFMIGTKRQDGEYCVRLCVVVVCAFFTIMAFQGA
jgi:hypothetical protein